MGMRRELVDSRIISIGQGTSAGFSGRGAHAVTRTAALRLALAARHAFHHRVGGRRLGLPGWSRTSFCSVSRRIEQIVDAQKRLRLAQLRAGGEAASGKRIARSLNCKIDLIVVRRVARAQLEQRVGGEIFRRLDSAATWDAPRWKAWNLAERLGILAGLHVDQAVAIDGASRTPTVARSREFLVELPTAIRSPPATGAAAAWSLRPHRSHRLTRSFAVRGWRRAVHAGRRRERLAPRSEHPGAPWRRLATAGRAWDAWGTRDQGRSRPRSRLTCDSSLAMRSLSAAVCLESLSRAVMLQFGDAVVELARSDHASRSSAADRWRSSARIGLLVLRTADVRCAAQSASAKRQREQPHDAQSELAVIEHTRRHSRYC